MKGILLTSNRFKRQNRSIPIRKALLKKRFNLLLPTWVWKEGWGWSSKGSSPQESFCTRATGATGMARLSISLSVSSAKAPTPFLTRKAELMNKLPHSFCKSWKIRTRLSFPTIRPNRNQKRKKASFYGVVGTALQWLRERAVRSAELRSLITRVMRWRFSSLTKISPFRDLLQARLRTTPARDRIKTQSKWWQMRRLRDSLSS